MSITITRSTVQLDAPVGDQVCHITASVEDSINTTTGDSICLCTVNSIISKFDGQTVAPATLAATEFRSLVHMIQFKHSL